jgi:hypothetical protein
MSVYGHVPRRHFRKLEPWLLRLETATSGLAEDAARGDLAETVRSLEDVWFWVGRTMSELLASTDELAKHPKLAKRAQAAMMRAAATASAARRKLGVK